MKTVAPDYYPKFQCIADRCRHTCCEGWEIDVDEASLEKYQHIGGPLGDKLRACIVRGDSPHFKLTPEERCPFLNENNLCELILGLGEDALCQICTDHPRFRSEFCDQEEIGLGLCCEAAAELVLTHPDKVTLITLEDDGTEEPKDEFEALITSVRQRAFDLVQDRSKPVEQRLDDLLAEFEIKLPEKSAVQWADFFLSLEQLDPEWGKLLNGLKELENPDAPLPRFELAFEQLAVYFLYRHLPSVQDETDFKAYLGFAVLGCRMLRALCLVKEQNGGCQLADLLELARLYSSEIEYSEENTDAIVQLLWDENNQYK